MVTGSIKTYFTAKDAKKIKNNQDLKNFLFFYFVVLGGLGHHHSLRCEGFDGEIGFV
jgi:hypothetical protein